jgi:DNA/RNA endonuclease YhcR with UshA esterase domain
MVGGYLMLRQPPSGVAAQQAPAAEVIPQDAASKRLAEVNAQAAALANGGRQQVEINPKRSAVFQIEDTERLINEKGREVTVEGRVTNVRLSDAGKTLYLEFSDDSAKEQVRGCIMTQGAPEDMSAPALKLLEGKRVQITGVVRIKSYFKKSWPEVMLKDRRSIKEM